MFRVTKVGHLRSSIQTSMPGHLVFQYMSCASNRQRSIALTLTGNLGLTVKGLSCYLLSCLSGPTDLAPHPRTGLGKSSHKARRSFFVSNEIVDHVSTMCLSMDIIGLTIK